MALQLPQFTPEGNRNSKAERLAALAAQGVRLADTIARNTLKEEVVLEYAENFRQQFVQIYPDRRELILRPKNEAGKEKFVCTAIRPTQPEAKDLYDPVQLAQFLASYVKYEPLDPPTEVPSVLPSPEYVLKQRVGDCLDVAVLLVSLLLGNGLDAYVVVGTAPKYITLKETDKVKPSFTVPADAVDRAAHVSPEALGVIPEGAPKGTVTSSNRYKLPPPAALGSTLPSTQASKHAEGTKSVKANKYDSDEEDDAEELQRLRKGYSTAQQAKKAATDYETLPETDGLHGQRVHVWVLVRAREGGGRRVEKDFFLEPSTGAQYSTAGSPYLTVEAVFNHKNYWVNMQAQSLIPVQDVSVPTSRRADEGVPAGPFGPGTPLSEAFKAALKARGVRVRGGGGVVAVAATAATLDGPQGEAFMNEANRPDLISPYSALLSAAKIIADKKGEVEPTVNYELHVGAPRLAGAASAWTVTNPLPAGIMKPGTAPSSAAPRISKPGDTGLGETSPRPGVGDAGADTPLGTGQDSAEDGKAMEGEGASSASEVAAGGDDKASPRPSSAAKAGDPPGSAPGSRQGSRSGSRSSSRLRGQRAQSGRVHAPGSMASWRVVLSKQSQALQAEGAALLAEAAAKRKPAIAELRWDFTNTDDWEYVLIPYEKVDDDVLPEDETLGAGAPVSTTEDSARGSSAAEEAVEGGSEGQREGSVPGSRQGSAVRRSAGPKKPVDKYANVTIEKEGEHLLDLPASWCPKFGIDRHILREALGPSLGHAQSLLHFRAKAERYDAHHHSTGMTSRLTEYTDGSRARVSCETTVFTRRRDGLFKRVLRPSAPAPTMEEHFVRGKPGALALIVDQLGTQRDYYFYASARVDSLLLRRERIGQKFMEWYGDTPSRLWYRSVTLVDGAPKSADAASLEALESGNTVSRSNSPGTGSEGMRTHSSAITGTLGANKMKRDNLTVEVDHKVEAPVRKLAEKYRRNPAIPAHQDIAKIVYNLAEGVILVTYHSAPGRLSKNVREYNRATGEMRMLSRDALEAPALRPFDVDNDYKRLLALEKECHSAMRSASKTALELRQARVWEMAHVDTERTNYEIALDRAAAGAPLEEEMERKTGVYCCRLVRARRHPRVPAPLSRTPHLLSARTCRRPHH